MTAFKALIGGFLGAIAFTVAAQGADMPGNWTPPAPRYVPLLSGWYLRGDIGYRWNSLSSVDSTVPTTSRKIGDSVGASIGAGYRYQWFRADVTLDHGFTSQFRGTTAPLLTSQPQYSARVDSSSALLNFYADFGTWYGFTPYVGAGAGVTYLRGISYVDSSLVVPGPSNMAKDFNFSWAWMAGVAIQVQPQWLVDVGFRHLELGDLSMTANTPLPTPATTLHSLSANELRIGLRYLFD